MNTETVGNRIRKELSTIGISQRALAKLLGVTEVTITRYIKGERTPRASIAAKMAEVFRCSVEYLLGIKEKEINCERDFYRALRLVTRSAEKWDNKQKAELINALMCLDFGEVEK
jgi:transcriptional regulator with XRE-family HTH domain